MSYTHIHAHAFWIYPKIQDVITGKESAFPKCYKMEIDKRPDGRGKVALHELRSLQHCGYQCMAGQ